MSGGPRGRVALASRAKSSRAASDAPQAPWLPRNARAYADGGSVAAWSRSTSQRPRTWGKRLPRRSSAAASRPGRSHVARSRSCAFAAPRHRSAVDTRAKKRRWNWAFSGKASKNQPQSAAQNRSGAASTAGAPLSRKHDRAISSSRSRRSVKGGPAWRPGCLTASSMAWASLTSSAAAHAASKAPDARSRAWNARRVGADRDARRCSALGGGGDVGSSSASSTPEASSSSGGPR
mmetsp:Transcript_19897/g.68990  ORF Transcript_19897/g.68990 Transcript_19897/m.68990 type:complete len:235 (-) Transcript_19897:1-705(-)